MAWRLTKRTAKKFGIGSTEEVLATIPSTWVYRLDLKYAAKQPDLVGGNVQDAAIPCSTVNSRHANNPVPGPRWMLHWTLHVGLAMDLERMAGFATTSLAFAASKLEVLGSGASRQGDVGNGASPTCSCMHAHYLWPTTSPWYRCGSRIHMKVGTFLPVEVTRIHRCSPIHAWSR
jgi:hypothetical protein